MAARGPGPGTITLLLRAPDDDAAQQRMIDQVLTSEPFAGGLADEELASGRLRALAADLAAEGLGGSIRSRSPAPTS